jgi:glycosyltransferase involved in cell wall biosynthesis
MRIAIDASAIIYETGVSTYTKYLIKNLLEIDKENYYVIFGGSLRRQKELLKKLKKLSNDKKNAVVYTFPIPPTLADIFWNRIRLTNIDRLTGGIDVFHSSDWTQPPSEAKKVTTVHDLVPIKYPGLSHKKIVEVHKRRLNIALKEVDEIIVPSNTTKKDLVEYGASEGKISVIYEAADPEIKKVSEKRIKDTLLKYKIDKKYIIAIGINPRKNTKRIIQAYKKLNHKDLSLVLIGENFFREKIGEGVKVLGHVTKEDLAGLYSGSEGLIYPSLYEGFGLPILEAFSCGVPVVTSNRGAMKEIAEDAAVFVDPESIDEIKSAIETVIGQKSEWIKKGKKRVKKFSWEKNARETLQLYNSLK